MTKQTVLIMSLPGITTFRLSNCWKAMTALSGSGGRMHRAYLEETNPLLLNHLILTGKLHSYLADLNKQAQNRCWLIIKQMAAAEGVTEDLKRRSQWEWIKAMNSIVSRTEEIIKSEIINA